jgi:hypothetical protein
MCYLCNRKEFMRGGCLLPDSIRVNADMQAAAAPASDRPRLLAPWVITDRSGWQVTPKHAIHPGTTPNTMIIKGNYAAPGLSLVPADTRYVNYSTQRKPVCKYSVYARLTLHVYSRLLDTAGVILVAS